VIDHLRITNFKAFASADIRLAPFTLLSGLNSSGKSTVLQALALLRQGSGSLEDVDEEGGLPLNGDIVELGTGQDVLHEDYIAESGEDAEIGFRLTAEGARVYECRVLYGRDDDYLRLSYLAPSTFDQAEESDDALASTCEPIGSIRP
jgi:predicted ATPase